MTNHSLRWIRGSIAPRRPVPRGFDAMDPGFHPASAPAPPNSMRWIRAFIPPRHPPRPIRCDGSGVSSGKTGVKTAIHRGGRWAGVRWIRVFIALNGPRGAGGTRGATSAGADGAGHPPDYADGTRSPA